MTAENDFAIPNAIYLKKMATADTVAYVTGLAPELVRERLDAAAQDGRVLALPDGAMLLEPGTSEVLAAYHGTYEGIRVQQDVLHWYERFEVINTRFIGQVTEWQQSDGDEKAERRLLQSAERLTRELDGLLDRVPRYAHYQRRFQHSMDLVDQGQRDFVCKPTLDSVHNIWFEFHEDILAVLGRPRDTT